MMFYKVVHSSSDAITKLFSTSKYERQAGENAFRN
jgi:hypothetical protein